MDMMQELLLGVYGFILLCLCLLGLNGYLFAYYYRIARRKQLWKAPTLVHYPMVTVQLPIYNEYFVVERLIQHVCSLRYPREKLEIQVLDDSTDETAILARQLVEHYAAQGINISYYHRENRIGFKAGALKEGLKRAKGDFIAIFDADFMPHPDFLLQTIPYFYLNEKIAMVQTRWGHINESYSLLTRIQAIILDYHFGLEQFVRSQSGWFMTFNGTAGVWRKSAILDAGNWDGSTLAEDLDLSYRAQMRGWKCLFLPSIVTPAELPADAQSFKSQQFRWAKGSIEVAKKLLPKLLRAKLPRIVKLQAVFHLLSNFVYVFLPLIALLCFPVVMLKKAFPIYDPVFTFFSIFTTALLGNFLAFRCSRLTVDGNTSWKELFKTFFLYLAGTMGLSINNAWAVIQALLSKKSEFVRTPKYRIERPTDNWLRKARYAYRRLHWSVWIELLLSVYMVVGIIFSILWWEFAIVPFLLLFAFGYGYLGWTSIVQHYRLKRSAATEQTVPIKQLTFEVVSAGERTE